MARMPKQRPGRSKQNYATPWEFVHRVETRLGIARFQHDFAADVTNSKGITHFDIKANALSLPSLEWRWSVGPTGWGWLNPPYANIEPWAQMCYETYLKHGTRIALLVPASVGSNWFRDYVFGAAKVLALNGRISFDGIAPYPKDCMLCLYGEKAGFDVWNWRTA